MEDRAVVELVACLAGRFEGSVLGDDRPAGGNLVCVRISDLEQVIDMWGGASPDSVKGKMVKTARLKLESLR